MTAVGSFSAEDWHELELAPLWVLSAVGGADGKVDKSERAALVEGIGRCCRHADEFVKGVFESVSKNFDAAWESYMADERFAVHGLQKVAEVLSRTVEPAQALHFKQTLALLGVEVADASGGVLGLGGKRSKVERKALHDVAGALQMSSRRLMAASQYGFEAVLVALDGSPEAEAALSLAKSIADTFGASVTLLHVVEEFVPTPVVSPQGYVPTYAVASVEELHAAADKYLDGVRSTYGRPEWGKAVAEGVPATVITEQALHWGADVIVMATSGSARLRRLLESKVTEEVVRKAEVPVLLVPVGEDGF